MKVAWFIRDCGTYYLPTERYMNMGTSNIIQYISDPILNQKNAVDTRSSKIHSNEVIVLQHGTQYCRAKGDFGRYAA